VPGTTDGGRAWVFGGAGALFQSLDDLWELDFTTDEWTQLPDDGVRPPARGSSSLAYHDGFIYMHGGHDVAMVHRDTWRYDLTSKRWSRLEPDGDSVAGAHFGYATDPICNELFLAGGDNLDNFDVAFTDRMTFGDSPAFARVRTSAMPPPRDHASLVVDGGHRRLVLFGGGSLGDGLGLRGDAWIYPLGACP
jgi:N-acetylneuraminic acid mutarotase